jgi:hypothetical protein
MTTLSCLKTRSVPRGDIADYLEELIPATKPPVSFHLLCFHGRIDWDMCIDCTWDDRLDDYSRYDLIDDYCCYHDSFSGEACYYCLEDAWEANYVLRREQLDVDDEIDQFVEPIDTIYRGLNHDSCKSARRTQRQTKRDKRRASSLAAEKRRRVNLMNGLPNDLFQVYVEYSPHKVRHLLRQRPDVRPEI